MKTVAVVPVKRLQEAKTRLAEALTPEQRAALTLEMLHHVLGTISRSGVVDVVAVVGPTAEGLELPPNIIHVKQTIPGLNHALGQGKEWAIARGAEAFMVVLGDLPLVTPDDITSIVQLGSVDRTVVLAPDRHNAGTNIMLVHPVSMARFAFGVESYPKHIRLHREAGARVETYVSPGTAFDIDTQEDLKFLQQGAFETFSWLYYKRSYTSNEKRWWYSVHTYSGYENKVKKTIEYRIGTLNMSDRIFRVEIPTVQEMEIRNGQRYLVQRRLFPGYVLVEMILDDRSLEAVQGTPGVTAVKILD